MPPLIAVAGVLGGAAVLRWAVKTARKINLELEEMRLRRISETIPARDLPKLRRDPASGAYRPD